jgi:phenylpyruvate tautomerase PptA (4-oxalocrotonate tautomerase family)
LPRALCLQTASRVLLPTQDSGWQAKSSVRRQAVRMHTSQRSHPPNSVGHYIESQLLYPDLHLCVVLRLKEIDAAPREFKNFKNTVGMDRNLHNVTAGGRPECHLLRHDKGRGDFGNTRSIVGSFKRGDARIRRLTCAKYGGRREERTKRIIHGVTKRIVQEARADRQVIVVVLRSSGESATSIGSETAEGCRSGGG